LHLLHRAGQRADGLFERHVQGVELTPRQFMVLQSVAEHDGLSQTSIMTATGIDRSSTADLVRRLVSAGCLQRRRTRRDARQYAIRLTPEGRRLLSIGASAARATEEALLAALPPAEREKFVRALVLFVEDGH
jgi:DNA-binding MarR family transcriptional regulator